MKQVQSMLAALLFSRATTPLILSGFMLLYIGIAFFTDEPLLTLLGLAAHMPLSLALALVPLNCGARLIVELRRCKIRREARHGTINGAVPAGLYDEQCMLTSISPLEQLQERLGRFGYRTRLTPHSLSAWRGAPLAPARILLLAAICLLFGGIFLSTTLRKTQRMTVIEGEPFQHPVGGSGTVTRVALEDYRGLFLERTLAIEVAGADGSRRFGLYPPSLSGSRFVYPRYLGVAPLVRFTAPDLPAGFDTYYVLAIYPPGKEDSANFPGSPYRIVFTMADPEVGNDPFRSGRFTLSFRIMKGDSPVASGAIPIGGTWENGGYRLALPDFRRTVAVDLVEDYGVFLIWAAALLGLLSFVYWLPVRLLSPCREMLFLADAGGIFAFSRAEGSVRRHGCVFHEMLDLLAGRPKTEA